MVIGSLGAVLRCVHANMFLGRSQTSVSHRANLISDQVGEMLVAWHTYYVMTYLARCGPLPIITDSIPV